MWTLSNVSNGNIYYLYYGEPLNIVREGKGHILLNEKSISRVHASLCIEYDSNDLGNTEHLPKVILKDMKSTNGTYINESDSRILPNEPHTLSKGDHVRFGKEVKLKLDYTPFVITSSQIGDKSCKEKIKEAVRCLGGHLVKEWTNDCSTLVMNEILLTTKTVCALAAAADIVTPSYLFSLVDAVKDKRTLPLTKEYLPPLKEPSLNANEVSFFPNCLRKSLFQNKKFYFSNEKNLKRMKMAVTLAKGSAELFSSSNCSELVEENCVLVKPTIETISQEFQSALAFLNKKGKSCVPESDIGLAIVYNSVEKYCNPRFKISGILRPSKYQVQEFENLRIYATETQTQSQVRTPSLPVSRTTVPESGESTKRKSGTIGDDESSVSEIKQPSKTLREEVETVFIDDDGPPSSLTQGEDTLEVMNKENLNKRKRPLSWTGSPTNNSKKQALCQKQAMVEPGNASLDTTKENEKDFECLTSDESFLPPPLPPPSKPKSPIPRTSTQDISDAEKSIPFNPFTLPSIDIGLDVGIEDEEGEGQNGERMMEKDMTTFLAPLPPKEAPENSSRSAAWFGKHPKVDLAPTPIKKEVVSQVPQEEGNEFALPFRSERKRRTRKSNDEESDDVLPDAKRAKPGSETLGARPTDAPDACPRGQMTIKEEGEAVEQNEPKEFPPLDHSAALNQTHKQKDTTIKQEANGDISDLNRKFKESLVVVEFHYLVKKVEAPSPTSDSTKETLNGLKNFKRFRKVLPGSSNADISDGRPALPHIIGGSDLVCSDRISNRIDTFLASQGDLIADLNWKKQDANGSKDEDENFDGAFNLQNSSRSKRRGRLVLS